MCGRLGDLLHRPALAQRREDGEEALPVGLGEPAAQPHRVGQLAASRSSRLPSSSSDGDRPSCSASRKVPPIAITSPTDFIEVPSVDGAAGNFSNAQRGILTTV